jgi:pilus assembly protein CpaB
MRNKRFFFVLAGALGFGLLAAVTVSRYLSSAQANSRDMNRVVVAKVAIPVGTKIIAEQVMAVQFSKESTPDGVFESVEKLVGRVAVMNIAPREPVTEARLAPAGTAGGLSAVIPEGYRAMTVKVDDVVGISGFIMPGTLVDVVVVITPTDTNSSDPISKIVLQSIKVLANGQNIDKPESEREPNSVKAVTLLVTPEEAEKLALASSEGKLQLVMRNSIDEGDEQTKGINKRSLLNGDHAAPQPEPGSLKSEQPAKTQAVPVPRRIRVQAETKPAVAQIPEKPRASVEMIEGAKKRSVDFP